MKRKKIVFFTGLTLIVTAVSVAIFRPYPAIDQSRVHPSLRGLDDSAKCSWTSTGDGGSMAILVERPDGGEVILCMSNSFDHSFFERGQLYIGAKHFSLPGATKIAGYDHTKFVVARMLALDLPRNPGLSEEIALMTKRIPDWFSFLFEAGPSEAWDALRIP